MNGEPTKELGLWGEAQTAKELKRRGYRILETRWRCRQGELDLIAADHTYICFVEVKLRKNDRFAPARAFVTRSKLQKIRAAALLYLAGHPTDLQPRFDVAEVYAPEGTGTRDPEIHYLENVF